MQKDIATWYAANEPRVWELAQKIWEYREPGLGEFQSCAAVEQFMRDEGFNVTTRNAQYGEGDPNTVIATWGEGKPVIGIFGELDALPSLSQRAVPYYDPIDDAPGHGCGHNLLAAGSAGGAAALKAAMMEENLTGTLKYFACPAEETIRGKVYLARDGVFDGLDAALLWHPGPKDLEFGQAEFTATTNVIFHFTGKTAHAAACPWDGRSALDAAELTSIGTQYLREHMLPRCRVHHVYPEAGGQPNVVPDKASIYFYIRSTDEDNPELVERVTNVAKGAALMTGTAVSMEKLTSSHAYVCNSTLDRYAYESALKVPRLQHTEEEYRFARELYKSFFRKDPPADNEQVLPTGLQKPTGKIRIGFGTSDFGELTHICPAIHITGYGAITGMPGHNWGICAISGTSIGWRAAGQGGRVLAQLGYDCLTNPKILEDSWAEFHERYGWGPFKTWLPKGDENIREIN